MTVEFKGWPKIPRYKGVNVIITEKIDGTNACIVIENGEVVGAQSRSRLITPQNDNYGFAAWVENNKEELAKIGDGYHFGEWAGPGIQKNPLNLPEKTFFLFNVARWENNILPDCVKVVPVLYKGLYEPGLIDGIMSDLSHRNEMTNTKAEGIIIYYPSMRSMEKYTFEHQEGKWKEDASI